jgi:methyltransferase-like protein 6
MGFYIKMCDDGDWIISDLPCDPEDRPALQLALDKVNDSSVSQFWKDKYEREAKRNWDLFYRRNETNFFKDRHYIEREFPQIQELDEKSGEFKPKRFVEIGCGVGNALFPLLERNPHIFQAFALDFSAKAIEFVQSNASFASNRCKAFVADIAKDSVPDELAENPVDLGIMLFVLSAIHPDHMPQAWKFAANCIKSGGLLFFRDYGIFDMAQMRLKSSSRLGKSQYVRCDGTLTYFFEKEQLEEMAKSAGFEILQSAYHRRTVKNRKEGLEMRRVWVQMICIKNTIA